MTSAVRRLAGLPAALRNRETRSAADEDALAARVGLIPEGVPLLPSGEVPGADVLRGAGEWLFEGTTPNRAGAQMSGDLRLSERALGKWQFALEARKAWLRKAGADYLFLVAPATHAVRPEFLPETMVLSDERPVNQLLERLVAERSPVRPIYPLKELRDAEWQTHTNHDSRWNAHGAFVAYRVMMEELAARHDVRVLERDDMGFGWREAIGDLGYRVHPDVRRPMLVGRPWPQSGWLAEDNCVAGEGRRLVTRCNWVPDTTCLVLGDWSAYRLLMPLADSFRRMVFAHVTTLDHELVEQERPDVVISVIEEARLTEVPVDIGAPSAAYMAAGKISARCEPMPTLAPLWDQTEPAGDFASSTG